MLMADRERLQERRLRLSSETWIETVLNFSRWFHRAAGRVDSLAAESARRGRRWLQGVSHSRPAFASRLVIAGPQLPFGQGSTSSRLSTVGRTRLDGSDVTVATDNSGYFEVPADHSVENHVTAHHRGVNALTKVFPDFAQPRLTGDETAFGLDSLDPISRGDRLVPRDETRDFFEVSAGITGEPQSGHGDQFPSEFASMASISR